MRLLHYKRDGLETELTPLLQTCVWAGDYREAARRLEAEITVSATDGQLPPVSIDLGDMLRLEGDGGQELFQGYVFRKGKSLGGVSLSLTAYDGLIYLIKSKLSKVFTQVTPEEVAAVVCRELEVPQGDLTETGIPHSFAHLGGTGYSAIQAAYTAGSRQNGKAYMPRMQEGRLSVIEKGAITAKRLVLPEQMMEAQYSEDMESMINQVVVTDDKGNSYGVLSNPEWVKTYGLLQEVYQREEGKDPETMAKAMFQDLVREASLEMLGGEDALDAIAGNAIQVKEAYTGLTGLFYIDADTHTFENGQHRVSLTLNFRNVMEEEESGEMPGGEGADDPGESGKADDPIWLTLKQY